MRAADYATPDEFDLRTWSYAGPVAKAYETGAWPIEMIVGPTGGGKSTASARRCLRVATWQHPSPRDGVRKARICVVCPTYRRAWDQVMPSYFKVFPQSLGSFRGSRGDPADHIYDIDVSIGGVVSPVHVEVLFRAVNDMDLEEFVRGFEVTAWWLPEADTNDSDNLLSKISNRVGRYPEPDDRPDNAPYTSYKGVFGDANAPKIGTWFHDRFYMRPRPGERLHRQPPGTSAQAENMAALNKIDPRYYADQQSKLDPYDFDRLIRCIPRYGRDGQPVHPDFDDTVNVAAFDLEPDPLLDLVIGVDAGSNALVPGVTFGQRTYSGQWRVLDEIYLGLEGEQLNTEDLGAAIRFKVNSRFPKVRSAYIAGDPAMNGGNAGSQFSTGQQLGAAANMEVQLSPSNELKPRRTALSKVLRRTVGPQQPGLIIDRRCKGLIGALTGGFHYPKRSSGLSPTPAKNRFSHVAEACEYMILTVEGMTNEFIRQGGSAAYDAPKVIME